MVLCVDSVKGRNEPAGCILQCREIIRRLYSPSLASSFVYWAIVHVFLSFLSMRKRRGMKDHRPNRVFIFLCLPGCGWPLAFFCFSLGAREFLLSCMRVVHGGTT